MAGNSQVPYVDIDLFTREFGQKLKQLVSYGLTVVSGNSPRSFDDPAGPGEIFERTSAIGPGVTTQVRPTSGDKRSVLISAANISANAAAMIRVVINFADDTEAAYWVQTSKRHAIFQIGTDRILRSPVPITSVVVDSDTAIAANTYKLTFYFGV